MTKRLLGFALLASSLSCGGGEGGSTGPTPNPVPTLTSLSRDTAMAGATPFLITLRGTGFVSGIQATIGGNARTTTRSSDTVATVQTVAADLATATTREVRVTNPEPGGGTSDALVLTIHPAPPVPVLDSISPRSAIQGSGAMVVRLHGSGFTTKTIGRWNGANLATTYVSPVRIDAVLTADRFGTTQVAQILAATPAPGGGLSPSRPFTVVGAPTITGATPDSVEAAPTPLPLVLRGTGLAVVDSVRVWYQGVASHFLPTAVTDTTIAFTLPRAGLASIGALTVHVHSTVGWSAGRIVEIYHPTPIITGVSPDTLDGSAAADTFLVIGSGFLPGASVTVADLPIHSTSVLAWDTIRAVVTEGALLRGGMQQVEVNDGTDGKTSMPFAIAITSPAPILDSISPDTQLAGVGGSLRLFGADFRQSGEVLVNGVPHPLTFYTVEWVDIELDSADVAAPGVYTVAFRTPGPGGGTSDTIALTVLAPNPVPVLDSVRPAVLRSDSGAQFLTLRGHGFIPGTVIELGHPDPNFPETDTIAASVHEDTIMVAEVPPSMLQAGRRYMVSARAPAPTTGISQRHEIPVWTTGVASVTTIATHVVNTLTSDTLRDLVYHISVDVSEAHEPTQLIARDPTSGAIVKSLPFPDHGGRLFYEQNGRYLYAICASGLNICRVDLDSWVLDWSIPAFTINGEITVPVFIAPRSGSSTSFVVAVTRSAPEYGNWVRVYDNTTPRAPVDTFLSGVHSGRFFGDTLVMMNGWHTYRRTVTPGGQSALDSIPLALNFGVPARILSSTRAITDGHLIDLTTGNDLATNPAFRTNEISMGPDGDRFYTATSGTGLELRRFDLATGAQVSWVGFPGVGQRAFTISSTRRAFIGSADRVIVVESNVTDP